jgi:hypothetical protein
MEVQNTIRTAFGRLRPGTSTAPFAMTGHRLFGLDVGDWSIVLLGLAFVGLMLVLV